MKKTTLLSINLLLLSACQFPPPANEPITVVQAIGPGTTLHLNQAITIPADSDHVYIAYGKIPPRRNYNTVDMYDPYCIIRIDEDTPRPFTIRPGLFEITHIEEYMNYYGGLGFRHTANRPSASIYLANGLGTKMYATIITLRSATQPEVKELECGHWDDYSVLEPITFEDLKTIFGRIFRIEKPAGQKPHSGPAKLI